MVPQSSAVLTGSYVGANVLRPAKDALYFQQAVAGIGKVLRLSYQPGSNPAAISLPFDGSVDDVVTDITAPGALVDMTSWTRPGDYYRFNPVTAAVDPMHLVPENAVDPKDFFSEEKMAPAPDGTLIPLSIVYKKGMRLDGNNPTALIGYGAYGEVWKPGFSRRNSEWIERGGILAVAHVRGGGEFGEQWRLAGQKLTKPNSWRDFIASAQYLIDHKYTSTPKLGIWSQSAGGILIGRAVTERPDLFAAAVDGVPCSDTPRNGNGCEWAAQYSRDRHGHHERRFSRAVRDEPICAYKARDKISRDSGHGGSQRSKGRSVGRREDGGKDGGRECK